MTRTVATKLWVAYLRGLQIFPSSPENLHKVAASLARPAIA